MTTIPRTAADSISSITEAVVKAVSKVRTVSDSISSITATVTRVATMARSLPELVPIVREYVTGALPFNPPEVAVVDLTIDGISYYDDVVFETAHFESQINGVAGTCYFRVRDEDRTLTFTPGQEIVLTINSQVAWRGFIAIPTRTYVFPALNVDDFGLARFIDITGNDINILLTRRIV